MEKIDFENYPSTNSPINATNLNLLQDNVEDDIGILNSLNTTDKSNLVNAINEVKLDVFSFQETKTNKIWINNKPIYRKIVDGGDLPNNTYKTINHGIENIEDFVNISGIAIRTGGYSFNIPFSGTPTMFSSTIIALRANATNVQVATTTDLSTYTAYFILEYTKT